MNITLTINDDNIPKIIELAVNDIGRNPGESDLELGKRYIKYIITQKWNSYYRMKLVEEAENTANHITEL